MELGRNPENGPEKGRCGFYPKRCSSSTASQRRHRRKILPRKQHEPNNRPTRVRDKCTQLFSVGALGKVGADDACWHLCIAGSIVIGTGRLRHAALHVAITHFRFESLNLLVPPVEHFRCGENPNLIALKPRLANHDGIAETFEQAMVDLFVDQSR